MKKKRKKTGSLVVWLGAMVVILAAAYMAIVFIMGEADPVLPEHSDTYPPLPAMVHGDRPIIQSVFHWHHAKQMDLDQINERLPDAWSVLVLGQDINANGSVNYLVIHSDPDLPALHRTLRDAGYTHAFRDLAVYEFRGDALHPVLHIDREDIRDGHGRRLIDQVPARNGYALVLEPYRNDALYDAPVKLLEIVMLNNQGREASDDIVIYWDPSEAAYKATNTFGAP
jgi:hypothetical protein